MGVLDLLNAYREFGMSAGSDRLTGTLGKLTVRDLVVVGGALLCVIASFVPRYVAASATGLYLPGVEGVWINNWSLTSNLFDNLVKGVFPLAVAIMFVIRRYANRSRFSIASLTLDQFAAVVGVAAALAYVIEFATIINIAPALGIIGAVAIIVGTSMSRYIGAFRKDFVPSDSAFLSGAVVLTEPKPRAPKPVKPAVPVSTYDAAAHPGSSAEDSSPLFSDEGADSEISSTSVRSTDSVPAKDEKRPVPTAAPVVATESTTDSDKAVSNDDDFDVIESSAADADDAPRDEPEAFWFAVPAERNAVDPNTGETAFTLEPGTWILALEDRGQEFLVQDTNGTVGVLRDLNGVERG